MESMWGKFTAAGLKALAVVNRFTNNESLPDITRTGVNWAFTYHGASSGTILADEREMGLSPYTGFELCTAVETMYFMSYLYQTMGDNDRDLTETPFFNVNTLGQSFGLEPNYPCCTVNHPQGYPKFLSASFVGVGDNGLGHALLSPAIVITTLRSGNAVTVSCNTDYPFGNTLVYTINATSPLTFSSDQSLSPNTSTSMHMISINSGQSTITYILSANIVIEPRANSTIAVHYGALLYALSIGEQTSVGPPTNWQNRTAYPSDYAPPQSHDWTINNTTAWDYAIDPSTLKYQSRTPSNSTIQSLLNPIFTSGAPPGNITAMACEIAWPIAKGVPAAVPVPGQKNCTEPTVQVTLVPYGAAKIHMAEFPTVQLTVPQVATRRASGRARGISWSCWFSGLVGSLAWGMWA
ncbi:MAG: hypothetical protein FRX48_05698 [Lasallia pustulata]|uniref:Uncharacterized protein n=1 Tax=Lasallia pustulata TaxID=136370 RepID=A0A5M8PLA3_9LECA|nr:MAG: hypothetical protein FRX48_05698 [Lasallia pustulata]